MPDQVVLEFGSPRVQQGSCNPTFTQLAQLRNPGEAFNAAAPHQVQEYRLSLVVSMVCG